MEQLNKKEQKRLIAMLLVCITLFNFITGNNLQIVNAEEVIENQPIVIDLEYDENDNFGTNSGNDVSENDTHKLIWDASSNIVQGKITGLSTTTPAFNNAIGFYNSTKSYFSGNIVCQGTLKTLRYSESVLNKDNYTSGTTVPTTYNNGVYSFEKDVENECKIIYLYAEDNNGNYATKTINLTKDTTPPKLTRVSLTSSYVLKKFGNFCIDNITITAGKNNFTDGDGVGIKDITLIAGTDNIETGHGIDFEFEEDGNDKIITINNLDELSQLWIKVEDLLGNSQSKPIKDLVYTIDDDEYKKYTLKSNFFIIDKKEPTIQIEACTSSGKSIVGTTDGEDVEWFVEDISGILFTANDEDSGIKEIQWTIGSATGSQIYTPSGNDIQLTQTYLSETEIKSGIKTVIATAIDFAGRNSSKKVNIGVDKSAPIIESCYMSIADSSKTLNSFAWGNYANDTVNFEIKATDALSGVQYVNVHVGSVSVSGNGSERTVTIPVDKSCYLQQLALQPISVSAVDNCNQHSEPVSLNKIPKTNISLNSNLIIEDTLPYADLCLIDEYLEEIENKSIVGKEFTVKVSAGDVNSGIYTLKLKQKNESGTVIKSNNFTMEGGNTKTVTEVVNIDIGDGSKYPNGIIKLQIEAMDYAGNIYTSEDYSYRLDLKAPTIEKYELFTENEGSKQIAEIVSSGDYGYYFPKDATVRIYASDGAIESSSGVKSIEYYILKKDSEPDTPITISGKDVQKVTKEGEDPIYYIDVKILDGFKGHIFARATDYARNQEQKYASTKGAIVETQNRHDKEGHIDIKMPGSSHSDSKGNPLYANDVTIPVTITDTMSGIAEISWEIDAPYDKGNNNSGRIVVGDDKTQYKEIDGWDIIQFDRNLAIKVQGDIKVKNNSNDIVLKVSMKDNAGNESTYSETLSIDKTNPIIEISFDNNDPDDVYTNIYSQNRTAYIVVKERNFSSSKIEVDISNTLGSIPTISDWDSDTNNENPDNSTHTAKITFSQDGDYTLKVSGEDAAGNSAESKSVNPFTIDKTNPEVTVTYSNNDVKNGNYYAAERTVIITVKDRNFASERVQLSGTYVEEGSTHSFPVMSGFTQRGDVYTATALCQKDGQYSFSVECRDKAGNQGTTYTSGTYHIDQTSPVIEFAGVEPNSANNGNLMPQVIMTDKNYTGKGINIKLTGANNGYVELPGAYGTLPEGETFTFNNFPKTLEYDDLYTIDVKVTDLAGNVTSDNITFSVNRFGSVYVFDETLRDIAGTYIQSPIDINLTEINLDTLERDTIKVVLDYNGTSRDLVEGEDYKVQEILGSGSWFRYNYSINRSLFEGDGRYIVALYSVDRAGNINQNTDETKKAEIHFGVDKTAPVVIPIDLEDSKQYAVDVKTATVTVNDNLVLKEVAIYINGKLCEHINDGENYTFDIPSSKDKQQITILATDMAGNTTEHIVSKILVNTNLFVRWYNNKPLFIGSLLTLFALCGGGLVALILYRRRKYGE